ncbi:PAS domain-containing protein [Phenylobacterium sp. LjRoot164]|uniref:sensor histidine kinase n=1 Tax=unclassified Phenylobacterium TaxID=2640670 RepID=UPI003ECEA2C0
MSLGRSGTDPTGADGKLGDETSAQRSGDELRTTERRFLEAQELAGVGVWEWNLSTDDRWWSPVVYQLWGLTQADGLPSRARLKIHPDDVARYETAWTDARSVGEFHAEWRVILPDGSHRWLAGSGRVERSPTGDLMLGVTQDVTERKRMENKLTTVLEELQHRVRNNLAIVRSVVSRTVSNSTSVEELGAHLDGRLQTLARTQAVFTRMGASAMDLAEVIREEMVAVAIDESQLVIEGPPVRLRREAAQTIALAIHELTTNAIKYGSLAEPTGRLAVEWRIVRSSHGQRLFLDWRESGTRALDTSPSRFGFGRELIEKGLPYELGAKTSIEFHPGGVRAVIEIPLSDRIAELAEPEDWQGRA